MVLARAADRRPGMFKVRPEHMVGRPVASSELCGSNDKYGGLGPENGARGTVVLTAAGDECGESMVAEQLVPLLEGKGSRQGSSWSRVSC